MVGDRFIAFGTWRWAELQAKTNSPVYRYYFMRARPGYRLDINKTSGQAPNAGSYRGAAHSAEIEYAMGNLPLNKVYDWQSEDYLVSSIMQDYFVNFIKTKNPNGIGLPYWPLYQSWQKDPVLWIDVDTKRQPDQRQRYLYLEKTAKQ
jgi:para-nitrobenzyl esterase